MEWVNRGGSDDSGGGSMRVLTTLVIISFLLLLYIEEFISTSSGYLNLIQGFNLAIISSFIFYIFNIFLPNRKEKKIILPYIGRLVLQIISNNKSMIDAIMNEPFSNSNRIVLPNKIELKKALSKINPLELQPYLYKNKNWVYLFTNRKESTVNLINQILIPSRHVDTELLRILTDILTSPFYNDKCGFNIERKDIKELSCYLSVFYSHFQLLDRLNSYYIKHLEKVTYSELPFIEREWYKKERKKERITIL
jgi:hypothetical protein